MTECEDLIAAFASQTARTIHLALIANTASVAGMYLDLALFSSEQARFAERLCDEEAGRR